MIDLKTVWRKNKPIYFKKTKTGDDNYDYQEKWAQCADESG